MRVSAAEKKYKEHIDYSDMDRECVALCKAINEIPGLATLESCCGHGEDEYEIIFTVTNLGTLALLLGCAHNSTDEWIVSVYATHYGAWPKFVLNGPIGGFKAAAKLAREIRREWTLVQKEIEERRTPRKTKKAGR